jgi:serine/threonine protein kinase
VVGKSTKLNPFSTAETVQGPLGTVREGGSPLEGEGERGATAADEPPREGDAGRPAPSPSVRDLPTQVMAPNESQSNVLLGAQSSERIIVSAGSKGIGPCLLRHEVVAYLGPECPKNLRTRVDTHSAGCASCQRWVRHVDDEILDYVGGQRAEEDLTRMDAHLDACKVCRELMHHVLQGMAQSWPGDGHDSADASTTFVAGNVVSSRYVIRSFLGRGGMGEVYEAFDRLMDRRIALKTMLCTAGDRARAGRRFKEEVRNAQRVGHPHVCRINDLHEHEGTFGPPLPFFTMEYVDGERLGNRLLEGPLPLEDVRVIAHQLLDGLRAAHQRGVLHLDFKSDNVLLRRHGDTPDAVIMDFGLSRVLGSESKLRTSDRRQFAGTLPYMSVEQLECREELGPATDIYAYGVVLYEMLTRSLPFEGDSLGAVLLKQLNERPAPPSRHVPGLSPALDRFVLNCLKSDPRLRYRDAGEALIALEAVGPWWRPRPTRTWLWKVTAPLAAAAVGGALLFVASERRPAATAVGASESSPLPSPPMVEQVTRELGAAPKGSPASAPPARASEPASASVPVPPSEPAPAPNAATPIDAPARTTAARAAPSRAPKASVAAPTAGETAPTPRADAASITEPNRDASVQRDEAPRSQAPEAAGPEDPASWKPTRVPKRLRAPMRPAPERAR